MITNHHKNLGHFRKIASLAIWGQEIGMEYYFAGEAAYLTRMKIKPIKNSKN